MTSPSPQEVNNFHAKSDKDTSKVAQHHSLGIDANQASPGDHTHDGKSSKQLLRGKATGFPVTANGTYSAAQMQAVLDALKALGAGQ